MFFLDKLTRRFKIWTLSTILLVGVLTLVLAGYQVRTELNALKTSAVDNVQWNLSQLEVDLLRLQLDLRKEPAALDLEQIRRRFDLFVSRVNTLNVGAISEELLEYPESAEALRLLSTFEQRFVPTIDGPDDALIKDLPALEAKSRELRVAARKLAITGIGTFARETANQRSLLSSLLVRTSFLAIAMLVALAGVLSILFRQISVAESESQQRQQVNARLSSTLGASLDAVIVADREGRIIDYNGAASTIFGYSREQVLGKKLSPLIFPENYELEYLNEVNGRSASDDKQVIGSGLTRIISARSDGSMFPAEVSIAVSKGPQGRIFVSFLRDISFRLEAEEDLRQARDSALAADRAKSNFLAVMSHEMRTPLNGIMGTLDLLENTQTSQQQKKLIQVANTSGDLLLRHINDVLDISKAEAGKLELNKDVFRPADIANEVIAINMPLAGKNGNTLELHENLPEDTYLIGDSFRLRQLLFNLVGNAIKFTMNGLISLTIDKVEDDGSDWLAIHIIDTGMGISPDDLSKIFEDFVTVDSSYERRSDGTGLGLGICKRMVRAMGGDIGVTSELGAGSSFWFRVPYIAHEGELPVAIDNTILAPLDKTETRPLELLVVEDNEINRLVVRSMLENLGHHVVEAIDGQAGIDQANAHEFDAIFMDISMPKVDGVTATKAIRAGEGKSAKAVIIGLTAHALPSELEVFQQAGMNTCLSKPIKAVVLAEALEKFIQSDTENTKKSACSDLLDEQVVADLRSLLGDEKYWTNAEKFMHEVDSTTRIICEAEAATSLSDLKETVHRLAGSAGTFGAKKLAEKLRDLETHCKSNDEQAFRSDSHHLLDIWTVTRPLYQTKAQSPV